MKKSLKKLKKQSAVTKKTSAPKEKILPQIFSSGAGGENLTAIYVSPHNQETELFFKELVALATGQILVVDDSENQKHKKLYKSLGLENIIFHNKNEGFEKSFAEIASFACESNAHYLVVLEARTPVWLEYLNHFFDETHTYDAISGSQFLDPQLLTDMPNLSEATLNKIISYLISRQTGLYITDAFAPYKAFKVKILGKINYKKIKFFPVHFWFELARSKPRFSEIPIPLNEPSKTKPKSKLITPEQKLEIYLRLVEEASRRKK